MRRALLLPLLTACTPDGPTPIEVDDWVEITIGDAVGEVDERYLSVAVDLGQVAGARFWTPGGDSGEAEVAVPPYDFDRPALRAFAEALAPAVLRIGGTESDRLFYALDDDAPDPLPNGYESVLTGAQFDGIGDFAADVGLDVMFTVNAGPGPRGGGNGVWDPTQTTALLARAADRGDPIVAWELGNEPNGFLLNFGFTPSGTQYAADLAALHTARDAHTPDAAVVAPSVIFWPVAGEIRPFLDEAMTAGGDQMDVVSWHYYPHQSQRCPVTTREATATSLLDPDALDEVATWAALVEAARDAHAPGAPLWQGETGNALCGGQQGVSDRWASTFWWVDQLGLLARRGHALQVRQTLSGSDYGLIDDTTLRIRPDGWASLLWKRLMGTTVLDVTTSDPTVRAYAHCHPDGGATLAVVRLDDGPTLGVDLPGTSWVLDADALDSLDVRLNGEVLAAGADGAIPALPGVEAAGLALPADRAVAFHHVADVPACPESP